jgi:hypothetical protein
LANIEGRATGCSREHRPCGKFLSAYAGDSSVAVP